MLSVATKLIVSLIIALLATLFCVAVVYYLALFFAFVFGLLNLQVAAEVCRSFAYGTYRHTRKAISFITGGKL